MTPLRQRKIKALPSCLEKAVAEREPWLAWFGTETKLDRLRDDERFKKVFRSTNNPVARD
jgi:hypothetical protein